MKIIQLCPANPGTSIYSLPYNGRPGALYRVHAWALVEIEKRESKTQEMRPVVFLNGFLTALDLSGINCEVLTQDPSPAPIRFSGTIGQ